MSDTRSDAQLIVDARSGGADAYAELYRRHHAAALRFARSLARTTDVDDLVSEAFARVLTAIKGGNGPEEAFRPYLLAAIRNAFYDAARRSARERPVEDLTPLAPEVPFIDPVMETEESRLVATAFGQLPERWQVVLWHTEVEGEAPADVAPLLGISPNAVAALAYRAREGLRERYLQAHVAGTTDQACRPTVERLAAFTRGRLSRGETAKVRAHLDGCAKCSLLFGQLSDMNSRLGGLIGPVVLAGAAAGYAGATTLVTASAPVGLAVRLRRLARRRDTQVASAAAAAGAVVAVVMTLLQAPSTAPEETRPEPASIGTQSGSPTVPGTATGEALEPQSAVGPSAGAAAGPAGEALSVQIRPVGSLVRGGPAIIALTVNRPPAGIVTPGNLRAAFTLPAGVTLRGADAGDGWSCTGTSAPICTRAALTPGATTRAYIPLAVSAGAANGQASVVVSGPGLAPTTATTDRGVLNDGLGAVFAADGALTVVAGGNSLLSCPLLAIGCDLARAGLALLGQDNNDWAMTSYVALGAPSGAPAGAAISNATISFGGSVVWAGLYWAGSGTAPGSPTAYVRAPGSSGFTAVTARRVDQIPATGDDGPMYQATAEITDLAASGTWWVAVPGTAFSGGHNSFGGWAVLAVVSTSGADRTVAVYDAARILRSGGDSFASPVYGSPGRAATMAFVGWEGDRGSSGDSISLGADLLGPASTNIARGEANGNPTGWNTFGTDVRLLAGTLGADAEAILTATTAGDTWLFGAAALVS